uniref:Uncharacterized protein n=1 Tax=Plectus sambesii TaxID=2011161 RepID=A0A914VJC7_9BILA
MQITPSQPALPGFGARPVDGSRDLAVSSALLSVIVQSTADARTLDDKTQGGRTPDDGRPVNSISRKTAESPVSSAAPNNRCDPRALPLSSMRRTRTPSNTHSLTHRTIIVVTLWR